MRNSYNRLWLPYVDTNVPFFDKEEAYKKSEVREIPVDSDYAKHILATHKPLTRQQRSEMRKRHYHKHH